MNWYRAAKVAAGEMTYGYWLAPDGTATPVGKQKHQIAIVNMGFNGYLDAWQKGYFRILTEDKPNERGQREMECGCEGMIPPTPQQVSVLPSLFEDARCQEVYVALPGHDAYQPPVPIKKLRGVLAALAKQSKPDKSVPKPLTTAPEPQPVAPSEEVPF